MLEDVCGEGERFGSGDGERKTLLTRQIAFEPLPASVLFALVWLVVFCAVMLAVPDRHVMMIGVVIGHPS